MSELTRTIQRIRQAVTRSFAGTPTPEKLGSPRMRAALQAMAEGVLLVSSDGTIQDCNLAIETIFGRSRNEMIGRDAHDPSWGYVNQFEDPLDRSLHPALLTLADAEPRNQTVLGITRNDGERRWLTISCAPVADQYKRLSAIVCTVSDITERFEAENRLQKSFWKLEKVTSYVPGMVYLYREDPDGSSRFPYASEGITDIYGFSPAEVRQDASCVWERIHPDDLEAVVDSVRVSRETLEPWHCRYRYKADATNTRWIEGQANPERQPDGSTEWYGYIHDVTAQVELENSLKQAQEEADSANRAKSEFLANMSHEIRTPMTAILGYAELMHDEEFTPDELHAHTQTIRNNAQHLLAIINDILDMSKIESGKMNVELIKTSTTDLVSGTIELLTPRAEARGITLEAEYATPMPDCIISDPTRLRQILVNLVGNAVKFTEQGSIRVVIAHHPEQQQISFAVHDTGIGMNQQQLERVRSFSAFSQADTSVTRRFGGTGLGLRISQSLAVMLGGNIQIDSETNVGSTFTLTIDTGDTSKCELIPSQQSNSAPAATGKSLGDTTIVELPAHPLESIRILLAEDGIDNQRLIKHHLTKAGAQVDVADNGKIAIEFVENPEKEFDLILMDMQMPELDGYAATSELRNRGFDLPIAALTAHAMAGDRQRCLDAGCDEYLTKPIDKDHLIRVCLQLTRPEQITAAA
ncbi:MAG: response regulator [Planctomycetota bacterium]